MRDFDNNEKYTIGEEIANSITHGVGALFGIAGLVVLIIFSTFTHDALKIVSAVIYGVSLMIMYLSSTLYHSIQHKKAKQIFEILDHSSIYLLIAGTYTPFTLVSLNGKIGWTMFAIVWLLTAIGIFLKVFFVKRFLILSTLIYIFLGWMIVFEFKPLISAISNTTLWLLVLGGVSYTLGTIFYVWRRLKFGHMVWHLFVLLGSFLHYFAVFNVVAR
ncbi:PAQR family membrane homeostasis protein TrhA [Fervidobacterium nodosum]|uniref:Channel protein, hemolysin III family n=1 Tax=Fervidobacterium nodosum (strain ATCC 35602 / DSM 5306 / Rt17-B1) TaxID=381764 RepID=A7HKP5_FERNB|nr:hemolysin III family protein [Fervidobacterium nodosum]ABS60478.1 channel protein, hemolysin III family [Fervidobacterium nodosum Rt17-B1]PHJ14537.1 hemolysin D [Fervidobacterium sp. SC_NGM5_G05]